MKTVFDETFHEGLLPLAVFAKEQIHEIFGHSWALSSSLAAPLSGKNVVHVKARPLVSTCHAVFVTCCV